MTKRITNLVELLALGVIAVSSLAACSGGEAGDLSDDEKIKKAAAGRQAQMGQQGGMPTTAGATTGK